MSVSNAHLGTHEYAFSVRPSGCSGAPNLYAHINHAFARAVTAFHVQACQECRGP